MMVILGEGCQERENRKGQKVGWFMDVVREDMVEVEVT